MDRSLAHLCKCLFGTFPQQRWLITKQWVISNVSTGFYDIDIEPAFFRWGYAWPLHNVVEASRQILFGLHSRIGLDFGVLFAWAAINTAIVSVPWIFIVFGTFTHGAFLVPSYVLVPHVQAQARDTRVLGLTDWFGLGL